MACIYNGTNHLDDFLVRVHAITQLSDIAFYSSGLKKSSEYAAIRYWVEKLKNVTGSSVTGGSSTTGLNTSQVNSFQDEHPQSNQVSTMSIDNVGNMNFPNLTRTSRQEI